MTIAPAAYEPGFTNSCLELCTALYSSELIPLADSSAGDPVVDTSIFSRQVRFMILFFAVQGVIAY